MVSADVLYFAGILILPIIGFQVWIVKKLAQHDIALAVLIQQVNPPGGKPLREMLNEIQLEQARSQSTQNTVNVKGSGE